MPTYEYECRACDHAFETMHGMTAPVLRKCPKCGKLKLERLISGGAGVIFKGSGFYETDYKRNRRSADSAHDARERQKRDEKPPASSSPESSSASKPESGGGAKSESKRESKDASRSDSKPKKDASSSA